MRWKKIDCVTCSKHRKIKNLKISQIFKKKKFLLFPVCIRKKVKKKGRIINWENKISWFNLKYVFTLKIRLNKT